MTSSTEECPLKPWQMVDEGVVAELTGLAIKTLQCLRAKSGGIPFKKMNGRAVRYRVADVIAWIDNQPGKK